MLIKEAGDLPISPASALVSIFIGNNASPRSLLNPTFTGARLFAVTADALYTSNHELEIRSRYATDNLDL